MSLFNAFSFLQGLETLHLRMERHCQNATAVSRHLENHPKVSWVNYPGLENNRYFDLGQKYMPKGASSILTFGVKGGLSTGAILFIKNVEMMSHLANIGDARTLIIHPASTTHRQLIEAQQIAAEVMPDMVRVSVGIE